MQLALKVDVNTLAGTRDGVPRILELLRRVDARATFLFSLGPDRSGAARWRRCDAEALMNHGGITPLLHGILLPTPVIGRRGAAAIRQVRDSGLEVGVLSYDNFGWRERVVRADAAWTERQIGLACHRFEKIFGDWPRIQGAAGWQTNRHALRIAQRFEFDFCSDCRGTHPFWPVVNAELFACPQLPTTLPTVFETLAFDRAHPESAVSQLLKLSEFPPATGHVYTARAEHEGGRYFELFEKLLAGWREMGYRVIALGELFRQIDLEQLPKHELELGASGSRGSAYARQGTEFLAE